MTFKKSNNIEGVFLPLQGPTGVRPKAPSIGAWQSPGYKGFDDIEARTRHRLNDDEWFGLRCDGLVVMDCDSRDAALRWCAIDTEWDKTWVRKTPRGTHFIYAQSVGSPDAPYAGVWPGIDVRAGRTSQIVVYAPGYSHLKFPDTLRIFDTLWLPSNFGVVQDRSDDESWDEIPDGRGNNTMAAIAGAMRKQGMSMVTIAKCLGAINRITMTLDPMPIEMVIEIAKSVSRYSARPDIDIEVEVEE